MELTKVQSSNVDAVGYLEQDQVLLVRFKDGTLYARTGVQPATYIQLLEAQSKGGFLAQWAGKMVFLSKASHEFKNTEGNNPSMESVNPPATPRSVPMTVNEMMKVKSGNPPDGCDFAVVRRR